MKYTTILVALAIALFGLENAYSQAIRSPEKLIERLYSSSSAQRRAASEEIFGAGIESPELYAVLATILDTDGMSAKKGDPREDEFAWHAKALASSGDEQYLPLLQRLVTSPARGLAKHSKKAIDILERAASEGRPYLEYTKVMMITEKQAEACEYVDQHLCKTGRSPDKCIDSHKDNAAKRGANAVVLLVASSATGGLSLLGGSTTMVANYYSCKSTNTNG